MKKSVFSCYYITTLILINFAIQSFSLFTKIENIQVPSKIIGVGFDKDIIVITSMNEKIYIFQNLTLLATIQSANYLPSTVGIVKVRKIQQIIEIILNDNLKQLNPSSYSLHSFEYIIFDILTKQILERYYFTGFSFAPIIIQLGEKQVLAVANNWQVYTVNLTTLTISSNRKSLQEISFARYDQTQGLYFLGTKNGIISKYNSRNSYHSSLIRYWNFQQQPIVQKVSMKNNLFSNIYPAIIQFDQTQASGYGHGQHINMNNSGKVGFENLQNMTGSHTFSCWLKLRDIGFVNEPIFSIRDSYEVTQVYQSIRWRAKVKYLSSSIGWFSVTQQVFASAGVWYFLSISVDIEKSLLNVYLDGVFKFQRTLPIKNIIYNANPFHIGTQISGVTNNTQVTLDQLKFFDRVLSSEQIQQQYQNRPFSKNNLQLSLQQIKQILVSQNSGLIFAVDVEGKIQNLAIDQNGSLQSQKLYSQMRCLGLLTSFRDLDQDVLITSDHLGYLKQYMLPSELYLHQQKTSVSASTDFLLSPIYSTGKFVSIELQSTKIEIWNMEFREDCYKSCLTCFLPANQIKCNSCQQIYAQFDTNGTQIGFECLFQCGQGFNKIHGKCIARSQQAQIASKSLSLFLSIPNIRIVLRFTNSIFLFLEDLWFYKYHEKDYTNFIQQIFEEIQTVNELKIFPSQLKFDALQSKLLQNKQFLETNYQKYTRKSTVIKGLVSTSFLANTTQILVYGIINMLGLLCVLLILSLIFGFSNIQNSKMLRIRQSIKQNTGIVIFVGGFFETNLIGLTFFAFQQLTTPFSTNLVQKLNIAAAVCFLFLLVIYSLCFFLFLYQFVVKQRAENLLKYTTWKLSSFVQATYILSFKNFFRGFIHGYLIGNNVLQLTLLTVSSLLEIIFTIHFRKSFQYLHYFTFYVGYCLMFLLLNVFFVLIQTADPIQLQILFQNSQLIEMIIVGSMCFMLIMLLIFSLIMPIYKMCRQNGLTCNNKVQQLQKIPEIAFKLADDILTQINKPPHTVIQIKQTRRNRFVEPSQEEKNIKIDQQIKIFPFRKRIQQQKIQPIKMLRRVQVNRQKQGQSINQQKPIKNNRIDIQSTQNKDQKQEKKKKIKKDPTIKLRELKEKEMKIEYQSNSINKKSMNE